MTATMTRPVTTTPVSARRLPDTAAFVLLASIAVSFLAGSSAPTPLYAIYQAQWHFSPITTTVVFGIYAIAVLAALLIFGALSDHVGRRPVLLAAIAVQAVTMIVFATASGVPELILARVIQGLSTGAAVGAIGAGLLDLNRTRGTIANAVAPITGTATGSLGSAVLVQFLPAPTRLVYLVLLGVFTVQAAGIWMMRETASPKAGALASLRPKFGVPAPARRPMLVGIPVLFAVWSLAGFYGSLGPALVRLVTGSTSIILGGLSLFILAGSAAITVWVMRNADPRVMISIGVSALFVGVGVTLLAIIYSSSVPLFLGMTISGIGFGAAFQGVIRTVVPLAETHERAGLLSTMYLVSYLGLGLPAVIAGYLVVHDGGVLRTAREYAVAVMALATLALAGLVRSRRAERAIDPVTACRTEPAVA